MSFTLMFVAVTYFLVAAAASYYITLKSLGKLPKWLEK